MKYLFYSLLIACAEASFICTCNVTKNEYAIPQRDIIAGNQICSTHLMYDEREITRSTVYSRCRSLSGYAMNRTHLESYCSYEPCVPTNSQSIKCIQQSLITYPKYVKMIYCRTQGTIELYSGLACSDISYLNCTGYEIHEYMYNTYNVSRRRVGKIQSVSSIIFNARDENNFSVDDFWRFLASFGWTILATSLGFYLIFLSVDYIWPYLVHRFKTRINKIKTDAHKMPSRSWKSRLIMILSFGAVMPSKSIINDTGIFLDINNGVTYIPNGLLTYESSHYVRSSITYQLNSLGLHPQNIRYAPKDIIVNGTNSSASYVTCEGPNQPLFQNYQMKRVEYATTLFDGNMTKPDKVDISVNLMVEVAPDPTIVSGIFNAISERHHTFEHILISVNGSNISSHTTDITLDESSDIVDMLIYHQNRLSRLTSESLSVIDIISPATINDRRIAHFSCSSGCHIFYPNINLTSLPFHFTLGMSNMIKNTYNAILARAIENPLGFDETSICPVTNVQVNIPHTGDAIPFTFINSSLINVDRDTLISSGSLSVFVPHSKYSYQNLTLGDVTFKGVSDRNGIYHVDIISNIGGYGYYEVYVKCSDRTYYSRPHPANNSQLAFTINMGEVSNHCDLHIVSLNMHNILNILLDHDYSLTLNINSSDALGFKTARIFTIQGHPFSSKERMIAAVFALIGLALAIVFSSFIFTPTGRRVLVMIFFCRLMGRSKAQYYGSNSYEITRYNCTFDNSSYHAFPSFAYEFDHNITGIGYIDLSKSNSYKTSSYYAIKANLSLTQVSCHSMPLTHHRFYEDDGSCFMECDDPTFCSFRASSYNVFFGSWHGRYKNVICTGLCSAQVSIPTFFVNMGYELNCPFSLELFTPSYAESSGRSMKMKRQKMILQSGSNINSILDDAIARGVLSTADLCGTDCMNNSARRQASADNNDSNGDKHMFSGVIDKVIAFSVAIITVVVGFLICMCGCKMFGLMFMSSKVAPQVLAIVLSIDNTTLFHSRFMSNILWQDAIDDTGCIDLQLTNFHLTHQVINATLNVTMCIESRVISQYTYTGSRANVYNLGCCAMPICWFPASILDGYSGDEFNTCNYVHSGSRIHYIDHGACDHNLNRFPMSIYWDEQPLGLKNNMAMFFTTNDESQWEFRVSINSHTTNWYAQNEHVEIILPVNESFNITLSGVINTSQPPFVHPTQLINQVSGSSSVLLPVRENVHFSCLEKTFSSGICTTDNDISDYISFSGSYNDLSVIFQDGLTSNLFMSYAYPQADENSRWEDLAIGTLKYKYYVGDHSKTTCSISSPDFTLSTYAGNISYVLGDNQATTTALKSQGSDIVYLTSTFNVGTGSSNMLIGINADVSLLLASDDFNFLSYLPFKINISSSTTFRYGFRVSSVGARSLIECYTTCGTIRYETTSCMATKNTTCLSSADQTNEKRRCTLTCLTIGGDQRYVKTIAVYLSTYKALADFQGQSTVESFTYPVTGDDIPSVNFSDWLRAMGSIIPNLGMPHGMSLIIVGVVAIVILMSIISFATRR